VAFFVFRMCRKWRSAIRELLQKFARWSLSKKPLSEYTQCLCETRSTTDVREQPAWYTFISSYNCHRLSLTVTAAVTHHPPRVIDFIYLVVWMTATSAYKLLATYNTGIQAISLLLSHPLCLQLSMPHVTNATYIGITIWIFTKSCCITVRFSRR